MAENRGSDKIELDRLRSMVQTGEFAPGVPLRPQRVGLQVPVRYRQVGDERWYNGRSENISQSGVLIRVAHLLPLKARVEIEMTIPTGVIANLNGQLLLKGGVARMVPAMWSGGPPGMAIAFDPIFQIPR